MTRIKASLRGHPTGIVTAGQQQSVTVHVDNLENVRPVLRKPSCTSGGVVGEYVTVHLEISQGGYPIASRSKKICSKYGIGHPGQEVTFNFTLNYPGTYKAHAFVSSSVSAVNIIGSMPEFDIQVVKQTSSGGSSQGGTSSSGGTQPGSSTGPRNVQNTTGEINVQPRTSQAVISYTISNPNGFQVKTKWEITAGGKKVGEVDTTIGANGDKSGTKVVNIGGIPSGESRNVAFCIDHISTSTS